MKFFFVSGSRSEYGQFSIFLKKLSKNKNKNFNKIKSQEYALLVGFGVGLSWGLCLIKKC